MTFEFLGFIEFGYDGQWLVQVRHGHPHQLHTGFGGTIPEALAMIEAKIREAPRG